MWEESSVSDTKDPKALEQHLSKTASGDSTGRQQLVFNPATGQLVVAQGNSPDGVVVDSINREGFFGT